MEFIVFLLIWENLFQIKFTCRFTLAKHRRLVEEIHPNNDLDERIQRDLEDRVRKEMVPYLLNEPQRFYGALVVAVYGGEPVFSPVTVSEHHLLDDGH